MHILATLAAILLAGGAAAAPCEGNYLPLNVHPNASSC